MTLYYITIQVSTAKCHNRKVPLAYLPPEGGGLRSGAVQPPKMLRQAGPLPSHFRISIFHFPISNFGRHSVIFSRGTRHEAQA